MENTLVKTAQTKTPEPTTRVRNLLPLHDRCDACGAQAFVLLFDPNTQEEKLMFCGHHYTKHEPELLSTGWAVQNDMRLINEKPSQSANA
jgi:hypothetical protein